MESLFAGENLWKLGVAAVFAIAAFGAMLRDAKFGFIFLGAMLFISGLGLTEDAEKSGMSRSWLYALQERRQLAYVGCAGLLFVGVAIHAGKLQTRNLPLLGFMVMFQGVYMGMITIFQDGPIAGLQAVIFTIFSMSAILFILAGQLRSWDDIISLLRVIALVGCVWTAACSLQFMIDQNVLLTGAGKRFIGLSGNPQHAAGLSAVMATLSLWLTLNDRGKFWKLVAVVATATHIIFVLWSGSRTGLALTTMGFTAVLYARLGRAVLAAPILLVAAYGLLTLAQSMGVEFGLERLSSKEDTRTAQWTILLENGLSNPIMGVGLREAGASENGFLYGFAAFGLGVPIIMAIIMFTSMAIWFRLLKARFDTPNPIGKRLMDLCMGFLIMYWAGNMFEGFGVARISPQLSYFLIFSCIAASAVNIASDERAALRAQGIQDEDDAALGIEAGTNDSDYGDYGDYRPA
jgi:hypothetical protein